MPSACPLKQPKGWPIYLTTSQRRYLGRQSTASACEFLSGKGSRPNFETIHVSGERSNDMAKYRKKPVVVDATQWFKDGGHIEVIYPQPNISKKADIRCEYCLKAIGKHGWIKTLKGGHIVCPADWIITGVKGEFYPCKPDIFEATYEKVEE